MRIAVTLLFTTFLIAPAAEGQDRAPAREVPPAAILRLSHRTEPARPIYARFTVSAPEMCYLPGTPGTPDVVIPGTPPTPALGDVPATPGTPPQVIPGIPPTPGYWVVCG